MPQLLGRAKEEGELNLREPQKEKKIANLGFLAKKTGNGIIIEKKD